MLTRRLARGTLTAWWLDNKTYPARAGIGWRPKSSAWQDLGRTSGYSAAKGRLLDGSNPKLKGSAKLEFLRKAESKFCQSEQYRLGGSILLQFHVSRLSSQQGCFLFNCNSFLPFEDSLSEMMTDVTSRWLVRISFPRRLRDECLRRLMHFNIHPATLFPDMDGLAKFIALKSKLFPYPHKPSDALVDAFQKGDAD